MDIVSVDVSASEWIPLLQYNLRDIACSILLSILISYKNKMLLSSL